MLIENEIEVNTQNNMEIKKHQKYLAACMQQLKFKKNVKDYVHCGIFNINFLLITQVSLTHAAAAVYRVDDDHDVVGSDYQQLFFKA